MIKNGLSSNDYKVATLSEMLIKKSKSMWQV